ncbi:hypothetical protein JOY44_29270 (plasmid) [Phormidium sp. CLA17]|uniref:hypothetical protein n=1 Tax=Leptolyngbya sp. Cla-17 TaxID=2803751 RepID=UPI00149112E5|nr:hypothetical protein [Leptolyngbya sp. Cla-17]MBM0745512.1 hypothetical protein [Leptolyngbya sp. Cla-17]
MTDRPITPKSACKNKGWLKPLTICEWVCETGTDFYAGVVSQVKQEIELTNAQIASRRSTPYVSGR